MPARAAAAFVGVGSQNLRIGLPPMLAWFRCQSQPVGSGMLGRLESRSEGRAPVKRAIVVSLVLLAGPVGAGVVFEVETKDHEHSPPTSADITIQSDGKNIKFDLDL